MANIEPLKTANSEIKDTTIKKKITGEEKRKYIAYGILGLISLVFVLFAVNDFSKDEKNKEVNEILTPESETDKYNSKLEAIQEGDKPITTSNNSLMDAYKEDETNSNKSTTDEETKNLEEEIRKMSNEKEEVIPVHTERKSRNQNYSSPIKGKKYNEKAITNTESKKSEKESVNDGFGDFFSSGAKGKTSVVNTNSEESDPFFYAAIKGDHLGLRNKQRVALMLQKDAVINGKTYKKNTILYAVANFNASRVILSITNINQNPINISAYDAEDGGLGLQVRESLVSETRSEMVNDGTDDIETSNIPFANTVKKLIKRKNKVAKIDLLNNQKLILKIDK